MAITKGLIQLTWAAANTLTIAAASTGTSDACLISASAFDASILIKAVNNGTPTAGDTVDFYFLATTGDPDAVPDVTPEYATQRGYIGTIDLGTTSPNLICLPLPSAAVTYFKLQAINRSPARTVTVSAQTYEIRS